MHYERCPLAHTCRPRRGDTYGLHTPHDLTHTHLCSSMHICKLAQLLSPVVVASHHCAHVGRSDAPPRAHRRLWCTGTRARCPMPVANFLGLFGEGPLAAILRWWRQRNPHLTAIFSATGSSSSPHKVCVCLSHNSTGELEHLARHTCVSVCLSVT